MDVYIKIFLLVLTVGNSVWAYDHQDDPSVVTVDVLPMLNETTVNTRLMPYLGNGHLSSTVFDDAIYVNGVYNGKSGVSHRARVPNMHNFEIKPSNCATSGRFTHKNYTLDYGHGVFTERLEDECVVVVRKVYAHQYYNRLLITQIKVTRKNGVSGRLSVPLDFKNDLLSEDFVFDPIEQRGDYLVLKGHTIDIEFEEFQKELIPIYIYFTKAEDIILDEDEDEEVFDLVSSIDINEHHAEDEMNVALDYIYSGRSENLYQKHAKAFWNIWQDGRIEVDNYDLQRTIYASGYYLMSSLPSLKHYGKLNQFYGLSPGSLSRGANLSDYQGHSFWDTETWMYPAVLMFYPTLAKEILSYRIHTAKAAKYNAKLFNCSGWRFPWESAYTGLDVTPDCCPEVKLYQLHISGDIAFAARQYISATRDKEWLLNERGNDLIQNIAKFWASRITYNETKKQFEIKGVLPPDEDAQPFVDNSIYTNIISSLSIFFANYTNCLLEAKPVKSKWLKMARCMYLPYSEEDQLHLEYEDYKRGTEIKQADTVLIGFPLLWNMDPSVRLNDLLYYENVTRPTGPAMTWSMHAIGHIEVKNFERAHELFLKSYSIYVREPFLTWTEAQDGLGAVNFITGVGGFLQALLFGYSGIRLNVESLTIDSDVPLPENTTYLYLHKIKYLNSSISFNYTIDNIHIVVESMNEELALELDTPRRVYKLRDNFEIDLPKLKNVHYEIRSTVASQCSLPHDKIDRKSCSGPKKNKKAVF